LNLKTPIPDTVRRRFLAVASLFLFFSITAQTSQYDINDPRNPHCPCHKYQKIADEEFAKLQRAGNKGNGEYAGTANSDGSVFASNTQRKKDKISKKRSDYHRKIKSKIHDKSHRKSRWIYEFKNWHIWKRVTNPAKCPIWNG
jgi:hypothetical protein